MRLLIVEADAALAGFLQRVLGSEGYAAEVAGEATAARELLSAGPPEFMVLDVDGNLEAGLELLRLARSVKPQAGAVVLISNPRAEDCVRVLDEGADDCLPKPFSVAELCARLRAVRRRMTPVTQARLQIADLELDRMERRVTRAGRAIDLTPKEFALLEFLMCHAGAPLSRAFILERVWNFGLEGNTNLVDVYINYLRKKMDEGFDLRLIHTVRGVGYRISGDGAGAVEPDNFPEIQTNGSEFTDWQNSFERNGNGGKHVVVR